MVTWGGLDGPGEALEASWRSLGAGKDAWSAKEGLLGAYGSLLEASWSFPGCLSWTVLEASWVPTSSQRRPKRFQNRVQEMTRAQNAISSKHVGFSIELVEF